MADKRIFELELSADPVCRRGGSVTPASTAAAVAMPFEARLEREGDEIGVGATTRMDLRCLREEAAGVYRGSFEGSWCCRF